LTRKWERSLKIKKIILTNWIPYQGINSVDFSSDEEKNITLIRGINRSGKTSIIRAIRWALYENTGEERKYKNPKKFINTEAANAGNHFAKVELRLSHKNKNITITREVKAKKGTKHPKNENDFDTTVTFTKDNKTIPQENIAGEINKLLHEDISVFYIVDGEMLRSYEELIIDKSSQKAKKVKEAIERVIGKPDLINIRDDLSHIEKQLITKLGKEAIGSRKSSLKELKDLLGDYEKKQADLDKLKEDYDGFKEGHNENKSNYEALRSESDGYEKIKEIESSINITKSSIEEDKDFIKALSKNTIELLLQRAMNTKKAIWQKENKKIQQQKDKNSSETFILNQLKLILTKKRCGICGRNHFNEKEFKKIEEQIISLSQVEKPKNIDAQELRENLNKCNTIDKKAGDFGEKYMKDIIDKNKKLNSHIENFVLYEADLDTAKEKNKSASKSKKEIEEIENKVLKGERNLGALKNSIDRQDEERDKAKKEYDHLKDFIEKNTPKDEGSKLEKKNTYVTKLREAIDNVVDALLENVKDEISTVSNDLHKKMSNFETGLNLKIGEDYSLTTEFKDISLHDSSGGDELVTLSFIGGLKKATKKEGPLLIDSPFGRLDKGNITNVLKTLPNEATQLILFIKDNELDESQQAAINKKVGKDYTIFKDTDTKSEIQKTQ
jgi:DNA sulfur modification protein DndD